MKHLRKFNELFDTEEIKNALEIPNLKGELDPKELANSGSLIKFDEIGDETIERLFYKLASRFPLFNICNTGDDPDYGVIIDDFDNNHILFRNESHLIIFSISIDNRATNRYDVVITFDGFDDNDRPYAEHRNIDINQVFEVIKNDLIPALKKGGFNNVLEYENQEQMRRSFRQN